MKPIITFTIALLCVLCASAAPTNNLTPWQKAAIATRFASEVKYNFAGYGKFSQNYDSICQAELPALVGTASDEEFWSYDSTFLLTDLATDIRASVLMPMFPMLLFCKEE